MLVGNAKMSLIGQMSVFTVFSLVRVYIKIQLGVGITDEVERYFMALKVFLIMYLILQENNVADILKKKQLFEDDADCFKSVYVLIFGHVNIHKDAECKDFFNENR